MRGVLVPDRTCITDADKWRATEQLSRMRELEPLDFRIAVVLIDAVNFSTLQCNPRISTIGEAVGRSSAGTVKASLARLRRLAGLIQKRHQGASEYWFPGLVAAYIESAEKFEAREVRKIGHLPPGVVLGGPSIRPAEGQ